MKSLLYSILAISLNFTAYSDTTNDIAKALKYTGYSGIGTTVEQAKLNHNGTWKNCIQYAFAIQDVLKNKGIKSSIEIMNSHAIIRFQEKGKTITYSNGKVVPNSKYSSGRKIMSK